MSLQFIIGPSGSGKTTYALDRIIRESIDHPQKNYVVLVPEQFSMQTQKTLIERHPHHGILNIDVLSFGRLAHRVLQETGKAALPVIDDTGKTMILRKVAGEKEEKLQVFAGKMRKIGYVSEMKSVISELMQYGVRVEDVRMVRSTAKEGSAREQKLQDLEILYDGFLHFLEDRFITREETLDILRKAAADSDYLKNCSLLLDGFTGFTPVQTELLGELMTVCEDVRFTVQMRNDEDPLRYTHPYQLFALGKKMVTSLTEEAKQRKVQILPVVRPEVFTEEKETAVSVGRFAENPEMKHLEENLFRAAADSYPKKTKRVVLHAGANPAEEAENAVQLIRRYVRTTGARYRDVGVIAADMETYGELLEKAFRDYEIPAFIDQKHSVLLYPFVEYVRSLLSMIDLGFTYESVFRYLRSGFSGFDRSEVDALENYCLAFGIRSYRKWQEPWIRRTETTTQEQLTELNRLRVMLVEKTSPFVKILRNPQKTVRDITTGLYEYLVADHSYEALMETAACFAERGDYTRAAAQEKIYRALMELLDKLVELLGDEKVSRKEYMEILDAGLSELAVGVVPLSMDQVLVGDLKRTRLGNVKMLVVVGANDQFLPGDLTKSGILTEGDRKIFADAKLDLAPGGKEQAYIQKYYLYMNLTKPSDQLHIFYSKVGANGKSARPAYPVSELHRLFADLSYVDEEKQGPEKKEMTAGTGLKELHAGFRNRRDGLSPAWEELYTYYRNEEAFEEDIRRMLLSGFYVRPDDKLKEDLILPLYGEDFQRSVSRMECFARCPFAHFLNYGLHLKEREEYTFERLDLGNVCHKTLEIYAKEIDRRHFRWSEITDEMRKELVAESLQKAITDYGNSVLYSDARNEARIARMEVLLERSVWAIEKQIASGDFLPEAYELNFGNGKIDRVDICEDEAAVFVRVTDYKTGSQKLDITLLYHGLQMQLPVYIGEAVSEQKAQQEKKGSKKPVLPSGMYYYLIQNPLVEEEEGEDPERAILKELRPDGLTVQTDEVLSHTDHTGSKEYVAAKINLKKTDGLPDQHSQVVSSRDFDLLIRHAKDKLQEAATQILEGEVAPRPYELGDRNGCGYCDYPDACGFNEKQRGCAYRELAKLSKEDVLQQLREVYADGGMPDATDQADAADAQDVTDTGKGKCEEHAEDAKGVPETAERR